MIVKGAHRPGNLAAQPVVNRAAVAGPSDRKEKNP